jgi:hypothetical protein
MPTQAGDHLASGQVSGTFYPSSKPTRSKRKVITTKKERKLFCECTDCTYKAYSAAEFVEHLRAVNYHRKGKSK